MKLCKSLSFLIGGWYFILPFLQNVHAQSYTVLKNLGGVTNYVGGNPQRLIQGPDGTLYGISSQNAQGSDYGDTIFRVAPDGSGLAVVKIFASGEGGLYARLVLAGNTLYGTSTGTNGYGQIFKVNTDGSGYTVLKSYSPSNIPDGNTPHYASVTISGATLYGTTYGGGSNNWGTVFKMNTDGTGYTVLKHFTNTVGGANPTTGLTLNEGVLYGTTYNGGTGGWGTLFKLNTDGTGFMVLRSFGFGDGVGYPGVDDRVVIRNYTIFGTRGDAGSHSSGTLYKVNTDGSGFAVLQNFNSASAVGGRPDGLAISGDTLFGTTRTGGSAGKGTVYKLYTDGSGFSTIQNFDESDGAQPRGGVVVWGEKLYGTVFKGGRHDPGGGQYQGGFVFMMYQNGVGPFPNAYFHPAPICPPGPGLLFSGGTLYGTLSGSHYFHNAVFRINADGSGFSIVHSFGAGANGVGNLNGPLVQSGDTLYGTSGSGSGTVFKVNTDGSGFGILKSSFDSNTEGFRPAHGLAVSGTTLYGTTSGGGAGGSGTLFKLNTDGTGFVVLRHFTNSSATGWVPGGRVVVSGDRLYGTTLYGGTNNGGTIFTVKADGTDYAVLKHFQYLHGTFPRTDLVLVQNTLYGAAERSGVGNAGVVFSLRTDNTNFTVLKSFGVEDGQLNGNLAVSGKTIYGTTLSNAPGMRDTVFQVNTDGTGFKALHNFASAIGSSPVSGVAVSGGTLYGMTSRGGGFGWPNQYESGVVFRLQSAEENSVAVNGDISSSSDGFIMNSDVVTNSDLYVGFEPMGGTNREYRAAVRLPLPSSLDPSAIRSATLKLYYSGWLGAHVETFIRAHRMLDNWPVNVLESPFDPNYTESPVGGSGFGWVTWDVTAAARAWAANPDGDFGILLVADPSATNNGTFLFAPTEAADASLRPVIELVYQNPAQSVGRVTMELAPPECVSNGARWRVNGGPWLNSGQTANDVPAGSQLVEFRPVGGWVAPEPFTVRVTGNHTFSNQATYVAADLGNARIIGQIPTQYIYQGNPVVLKVTGPLGPGTLNGYAASAVSGTWSFTPSDGVFRYIPATTNDPTFQVYFSSQNGGNFVSQYVTFVSTNGSLPRWPTVAFSSPGAAPDGAAGKYVRASVTATNAPELFNSLVRTTYDIEVVGKTVIFEAGHTNGLYDGWHDQSYIQDLTIHAETLIVRSPLHLPQTAVTIHARELRFEGSAARIDTTPRSLTMYPAEATTNTPAANGANGMKAGDVTAYLERIVSEPVGPTRFILNGGNGQPGGLGLSGAEGESKATVYPGYYNVRNPSRTTAAWVREYPFLCTIGCALLSPSPIEEHYWPSEEFYNSPVAWKPTDGGVAKAGGKPGNGGAGGNVFGSLRLIDVSANPGGRSASVTFHARGNPGGPQPAYKARNMRHVEYTLLPNDEFQFQGYTDDWDVSIWPNEVVVTPPGPVPNPQVHISQPGESSFSPAADFELGSQGEFRSVGSLLSWLSPHALALVVTNAEDTYLAGHLAEADQTLADYEAVLIRYPSLPEWQELDPEWQTAFNDLLAQIQLLRQRIASHSPVLGSDLTLTANASGTAPLSYQWLFNGTALGGATNQSLLFSSLGFAQQGNYQVIVSNSLGSVTSAVTSVTVALPPGANRIAGALLPGGALRLSLTGYPGMSYALERSYSLVPPLWIPQLTNVSAPDGGVVFTNAPDPSTNNFWRVRLQP